MTKSTVSMTVSEAADALRLPGPTPGARAQLLRRLEARGILPPARRTILSNERYYMAADIADAKRRLEEWRRHRSR